MLKGKVYFKLISDSELKEILVKNKNLFLAKGTKLKSIPLIGTANCNK